MRFKLLGVSLALAVFSAFPQQPPPVTVGTKYVYCELIGVSVLGNLTKTVVSVDYGNDPTFNPFRDKTIKDENGKIKGFNSMVDALNYMGDGGWEFVQAYVVTTQGGMLGPQNTYHWLLKRKMQ